MSNSYPCGVLVCKILTLEIHIQNVAGLGIFVDTQFFSKETDITWKIRRDLLERTWLIWSIDTTNTQTKNIWGTEFKA